MRVREHFSRQRRSATSGHGSDDAAVTDLALKAGAGDRQALSAFIEATHGDVWRLLAHLADTDRADDLTQETYLRVLGALPRFAARSSARTWILSLARRVWVDSVRHDMARPRKSVEEWEDAAGQTPSSDTAGDQAWAELVDARAMLDNLPTERREALVLTQILGYSYAEAADICDVRVGTIRSRVARARADLLEAQKNARRTVPGTAGSQVSSRGSGDTGGHLHLA
ncbi:RNA polymerase sigma factor [Corynebacterium provencense]|nr:RNA polymerase sigma factor [Corynebacterium provencense]